MSLAVENNKRGGEIVALKKHNKIGRVLFYLGTLLSAFGIAFKNIKDTPESFSTFSIPLIIIGVILLIASNFYKESKESQ